MKQENPGINSPAPIYVQMRQRVLETDPKTVGLVPGEVTPRVWGVMMEFITGNTAVTLVSLTDGTTSMYFGNGGGIIGGGGDPGVAQASRDLVALAESYLEDTEIAGEIPLISRGMIRFVILAYQGIYAVEVPEARLFKGQHVLVPLFNQANRVITTLRTVQENSPVKKAKKTL